MCACEYSNLTRQPYFVKSLVEQFLVGCVLIHLNIRHNMTSKLFSYFNSTSFILIALSQN
jgi:hypothetical protein